MFYIIHIHFVGTIFLPENEYNFNTEITPLASVDPLPLELDI